jgi:hypothetical protein
MATEKESVAKKMSARSGAFRPTAAPSYVGTVRGRLGLTGVVG